MNTKSSLIIGISLIIGATIFGEFFYSARAQRDSIRVVGSATKRYKSDIVKWRISIARVVSPKEIQAGYDLLKNDLQALMAFFASHNVPQSSITTQPVNINPIYDREGMIGGYSVQQNIYVISNDVEGVERIALNPSELATKGVYLQSSYLEYTFSDLPSIKKELLALATIDARNRAEEIAKSSGAKIGRMISARTGVFQFNEPYSYEISDYGIYNTSSKEKDVTVTINATFTLK